MPSPDRFHPEFGYLCPTPRFRSTLRVSLVAGVLGAMTGAVGVLAMVLPHPSPDRVRSETALTLSPADPLTTGATVGVASSSGKACSAPDKCPLATTAAAPSGWPAPAADAAGVASDPGELAIAKPLPSAATPAKKRRKVVRREPPPDRQDAEPRSAYAVPYGHRRYEGVPYGDRRHDLAPYEPRRDGLGFFFW